MHCGKFTIEVHDSPDIFNISHYFLGFVSQTNILGSIFFFGGGKLLKERCTGKCMSFKVNDTFKIFGEKLNILGYGYN